MYAEGCEDQAEPQGRDNDTALSFQYHTVASGP
jgi:hypothetical protein